MKNSLKTIFTILLLTIILISPANAKVLKVVATLPDYADFAKIIGQDKIEVTSIVKGNQDAHFIRPKPSFVVLLQKADVLIATGLDLEMWLPTAVDKSSNKKIRSGEIGYVAVTSGLELKEKPTVMSRIEGGLHIYGNPHITVSPLNMLTVIDNIAIGLSKNSKEHKEFFQANAKALRAKLINKLYGEKLITMLGADTLVKLHKSGKLHSFLENKKFKGSSLLSYLGGWTGKLLKLRNTEIVTYHKNWKYFFDAFELAEGGFIEPKPGIPPSPKHVNELKNSMKKHGIKLILAASYFNNKTTEKLAREVGGIAITVPYYVGGTPKASSYIKLVDYWVESLLKASNELKGN